MLPFSIAMLRASFAQVEPNALELGRVFYRRLFARHPELRPLFGEDADTQAARLMGMVAAGVQLLERPETLSLALRGLGARHHQYGVRPEHYLPVGVALLDTLAEALGEAFTAEVRAAWSGFYAHVAAAMLAGAPPLADAA